MFALLKSPAAAAPRPLPTVAGQGFGLPRDFIVRQLRSKLSQLFLLEAQACSAWCLNRDGHWIALEEDQACAHSAPAFALQLCLPRSDGDLRRTVDFEVAIFEQQYLIKLPRHQISVTFLPALDQRALALAARAVMQQALQTL